MVYELFKLIKLKLWLQVLLNEGSESLAQTHSKRLLSAHEQFEFVNLSLDVDSWWKYCNARALLLNPVIWQISRHARRESRCLWLLELERKWIQRPLCLQQHKTRQSTHLQFTVRFIHDDDDDTVDMPLIQLESQANSLLLSFNQLFASNLLVRFIELTTVFSEPMKCVRRTSTSSDDDANTTAPAKGWTFAQVFLLHTNKNKNRKSNRRVLLASITAAAASEVHFGSKFSSLLECGLKGHAYSRVRQARTRARVVSGFCSSFRTSWELRRQLEARIQITQSLLAVSEFILVPYVSLCCVTGWTLSRLIAHTT